MGEKMRNWEDERQMGEWLGYALSWQQERWRQVPMNLGMKMRLKTGKLVKRL